MWDDATTVDGRKPKEGVASKCSHVDSSLETEPHESAFQDLKSVKFHGNVYRIFANLRLPFVHPFSKKQLDQNYCL